MPNKDYTSSQLFQLEILFLQQSEENLSKQLNIDDSVTKEIITFMLDLINARYLDVLMSDFAKQFLDRPKSISHSIEDYLVNKIEKEKEVLRITLVGIACLSAFAQENWTGPKIKNEEHVNFINNILNNFERKEIIEDLYEEGCDGVYVTPTYLPLLIISRDIFSFPFPIDNEFITTKWFHSRCLMLQQNMLKDRSEVLKNKLIRSFEPVTEFLERNVNIIPKDILAMNYIERGYAKNMYREVASARGFWEKAKSTTGLKLELSGALGRKTKFQTFDTSQLIVVAQSSINNDNANCDNNNFRVPSTVDTEDTIVLQQTKYVNPNLENSKLSFIDQLILVTQIFDNQNFNPMLDPMTIEENLAYLQRLGQECSNWLIHSMYLYQKSIIESKKSKTSERAVLQVQSLVDQYDDDEPNVKERMKFFYSVNYPAKHIMKTELGKQYLKLGVAASARELFLELEMWPELIHSYVILNEIEKAEKIVRDRLAVEETPELWCILGEVLQDDQYYIKSWELSNHKFSKSQRLLARSYLNKKLFNEAIESFNLSLAINPIHPSAWFSLGCACLSTSRWNEASIAFSRVVQLEPTDGESWSNLGVAFLKLSKLEEAHTSFQEGVKFSFDSWKMWENLLLVSCQLGYIFQAIQCLHRLFDLLGNKTDFSIISEIVRNVICEIKKNTCNKQLLEQVKELLGRASSIVATNPDLWHSYSELEEALGNFGKSLDYRLKQIRQLQVVDWQSNKDDFLKVAKAELSYINSAKLLPTKRNLHSVKLHLRGILSKTRENFENTAEFERLTSALEDIIELEKNAEN